MVYIPWAMSKMPIEKSSIILSVNFSSSGVHFPRLTLELRSSTGTKSVVLIVSVYLCVSFLLVLSFSVSPLIYEVGASYTDNLHQTRVAVWKAEQREKRKQRSGRRDKTM